MQTVFWSNAGRPNEKIGVELNGIQCWEKKTLKAIFFLIEMAAEGRGVTFLTRALQFAQVLRNCSGIQDLLSPLSF